MLKELFLLDEGPVQKVSASNGCGWWITRALHSQYRDQPILFRGQIWSTVAVSEYNCDHSDIKTNNGPPPFLTRLASDIPPGHPVVTASARSGPGRLLTFDDPAGGQPRLLLHTATLKTQNKCSVELELSLWVDTSGSEWVENLILYG